MYCVIFKTCSEGQDWFRLGFSSVCHQLDDLPEENLNEPYGLQLFRVCKRWPIKCTSSVFSRFEQITVLLYYTNNIKLHNFVHLLNCCVFTTSFHWSRISELFVVTIRV